MKHSFLVVLTVRVISLLSITKFLFPVPGGLPFSNMKSSLVISA